MVDVARQQTVGQMHSDSGASSGGEQSGATIDHAGPSGPESAFNEESRQQFFDPSPVTTEDIPGGSSTAGSTWGTPSGSGAATPAWSGGTGAASNDGTTQVVEQLAAIRQLLERILQKQGSVVLD